MYPSLELFPGRGDDDALLVSSQRTCARALSLCYIPAFAAFDSSQLRPVSTTPPGAPQPSLPHRARTVAPPPPRAPASRSPSLRSLSHQHTPAHRAPSCRIPAPRLRASQRRDRAVGAPAAPWNVSVPQGHAPDARVPPGWASATCRLSRWAGVWRDGEPPALFSSKIESPVISKQAPERQLAAQPRGGQLAGPAGDCLGTATAGNRPAGDRDAPTYSA